MRKSHAAITLAAALAMASSSLSPAMAQKAVAVAAQPGAPIVSRISAGTYTIDEWHSSVVWSVNHMGFNMLNGIFGNPAGTMTLDPAHPERAAVSLVFPIAKVLTTRPALTTHMLTAAILDATAFPTATFRSTRVVVRGMNATVTGNLTLHGVTKPIVLAVHFMGAGVNAMDKKTTVGFTATGSINRSDFGVGYGVPNVSDKVELNISAAFERDN
jgi:polyisoprenoid-binding protein YceI